MSGTRTAFNSCGNRRSRSRRISWAALAAIGAVAAGLQAPAPAVGDELDDLKRRVEILERQKADGTPDVAADDTVMAGDDDPTGTDPRSFGTKFMPYYRYERLKNDLEVNQLVLFGLIRFSDSVAATYELPIAKRIDYNSVSAFRSAKSMLGMSTGELPPTGGCGGLSGAPCNGVPFDDLDTDGDNTGLGDFNFRLFVKGFAVTDSPLREGGQLELMTGAEVTVPSATDDILGSQSLILSPMLTFIMDMPLHGFFAAMNFVDFDLWHDKSRGHTNRYRGRWFYMQPLTPPDMGALGGFYLLPEFQPVYDFATSDFSFWVGPELGKIISPGKILYLKPGWGVDQDSADRQFTFETGFRWFF
jgi:hypothetical protein